MSAAALKAIVDANGYMTLATADEDGRPWASPVWFATVDYREFFWVSSPGARHSQNIASRPGVAIVIFDSQQVPGMVEAVYIEATAGQLPEGELDRGLAVFSGVSEAKLATPWTLADVQGSARLRLFRANALAHFVLASRDERVRVKLS